MIKLILFDIDGTLIRSVGAGSMAFGRAFDTLFNLPDAAQGLDFAGRTDISLLREFLGQHDIQATDSLERSFFHVYSHWLAQLLPQVEGCVLPGAQHLLTALQSMEDSPCIGLLTGNTRLGAEIKLRHFGLWKGFQLGSFGDEDPCRNVLARLAAQRGKDLLESSLPHEEVLVIGDTPLDVACAQSIGAKCLAVATGNSKLEGLEQAGATHAVASLEDIDPDTLLGL
ncbi:MAG: HAD hydrolase-like protein [Verrucomicrobiota bacterium]|nr:HAD hydrolase-like protein [Verrucomicrobiota bacterium]